MSIAGSVLDHVAFGVKRVEDPQAWLAAAGASALEISDAPGFRVQQWLFRSGMRLEVLAPYRVEESDFLKRFIQANGPGPHHLTFRVDDLAKAMGELEEAGFPILYSNLDDPAWMEAFIHPKHAGGTVVQVAQTPFGWDVSNVSAPSADLVAVNVEVPEMARALVLYRDLLGGDATEDEEGVVLSWPGTGKIALRPTSDGGSTGRIASLSFDGPTVSATYVPELGASIVS